MAVKKLESPLNLLIVLLRSMYSRSDSSEFSLLKVSIILRVFLSSRANSLIFKRNFDTKSKLVRIRVSKAIEQLLEGPNYDLILTKDTGLRLSDDLFNVLNNFDDDTLKDALLMVNAGNSYYDRFKQVTFTRYAMTLLILDSGKLGRDVYDLKSLLPFIDQKNIQNHLYKILNYRFVKKAVGNGFNRYIQAPLGLKLLPNEMKNFVPAEKTVDEVDRPSFVNYTERAKYERKEIYKNGDKKRSKETVFFKKVFKVASEEASFNFSFSSIRLAILLKISKYGPSGVSSRELNEFFDEVGYGASKIVPSMCKDRPSPYYQKNWIWINERTEEGYVYSLTSEGEQILKRMGVFNSYKIDSLIKVLLSISDSNEKNFQHTAIRIYSLLLIGESAENGLSSEQLKDLLDLNHYSNLDSIIESMSKPDEVIQKNPGKRNYLYSKINFRMKFYYLSDHGKAYLKGVGVNHNW